MDGQGTRAATRAQPVADVLTFHGERTRCATLVWRPLALGHEQSVRDSDRRDVQHRAEVQCEARAARVVATGCVDEQDVRQLAESSDRSLEEWAFTQGEQARLVRGACLAFDHRGCGNLAAAKEGSAGPSGVAGLAGTVRFPACEADEAAADRELSRRRPRRRLRPCESFLLADELL
jgi:hypothetical protein